MYKNYEILEVTTGNEKEYLHEIAQLEQLVLDDMINKGKEGQLFITGKDDISQYIKSNENHVYIAVKQENCKNCKQKVIATTYITEGQIPYTYNDITKYFKCDDKYKEHVKSKYKNSAEYEKAIRKSYIEKILAFRYARNVILEKFLSNEEKELLSKNMDIDNAKNEKLLELIKLEYNNPKNQFHEKSKIREEFNRNMSLYMMYIKKDLNEYNDFYWLNFDDLKNEFLSKNSEKVKNSLNQFESINSDIKTYDEIMRLQKHKIYEKSNNINLSKYYNAHTYNTIEIDTYLTIPNEREKGLAKILVFEGLKETLKKQANNTKNEDVYLVSTLHKDNYSSKYVSEFFGLKDYLFVNRRAGRDRQVHILGMKRSEIPQYIEKMEKKFAVLYDYNPGNINISNKDKLNVLQEQLQYEEQELERLGEMGNSSKMTDYINKKHQNVMKLKSDINLIQNKEEKLWEK